MFQTGTVKDFQVLTRSQMSVANKRLGGSFVDQGDVSLSGELTLL